MTIPMTTMTTAMGGIPMANEFVLRAALACFGLALIAGPVGCFIVWRRMAFFGHAVSHAALLGVAVGLALGINLMFGVIAIGMAVALMLVGLEARRILATDTLIGILGHASLAAGLVALSFMPNIRMDLMGYLFGDVLATSRGDVILIFATAILILGLMAWMWRPLLAITVSEDLARVEGIPTLRIRIVYMLMVASVIAVGMQVVGVLLIIALLIIPAAAARPLAQGPGVMALLATGISIVAGLSGLWFSFLTDAPAGPSIVLTASLIFALTFVGTAVRAR